MSRLIRKLSCDTDIIAMSLTGFPLYIHCNTEIAHCVKYLGELIFGFFYQSEIPENSGNTLDSSSTDLCFYI